MKVGAGLLLVAAACVASHGVRAGADVGVVVERWTVDRCRAAPVDRDADGIDDDCEFALARAFAPVLVVDASDCAWEADAGAGQLGGGYLFAAEGAPGGRALRIAYLPAYYRDCGWQGVPCATRGPGCSAHDGDSELVVVEVRFDPDAVRWLTDAVFLSAHCFGRSDGRCRWYTGDDLLRFAWAGGTARSAPRVWVAKGKHANYPSQADCDSGHWFYDSCDANAVAYRFPVITTAQNIGSRRRPRPAGNAELATGCLSAARLQWRTPLANPEAQECFWNDSAVFRGWRRPARGEAPTPYSRALRLAAGF